MRAFTLVEMLAVVTLGAMAVAVGAVQLSGTSARARADAAVNTLVVADATARSIAVAEGSCRLWVRDEGREVVVEASGQDAPPWRRRLPSGVVAALEVVGGELRFDAAGRCRDYRRVVRVDGEVVRAALVSGVSGWAERVDGGWR